MFCWSRGRRLGCLTHFACNFVRFSIAVLCLCVYDDALNAMTRLSVYCVRVCAQRVHPLLAHVETWFILINLLVFHARLVTRRRTVVVDVQCAIHMNHHMMMMMMVMACARLRVLTTLLIIYNTGLEIFTRVLWCWWIALESLSNRYTDTGNISSNKQMVAIHNTSSITLVLATHHISNTVESW